MKSLFVILHHLWRLFYCGTNLKNLKNTKRNETIQKVFFAGQLAKRKLNRPKMTLCKSSLLVSSISWDKQPKRNDIIQKNIAFQKFSICKPQEITISKQLPFVNLHHWCHWFRWNTTKKKRNYQKNDLIQKNITICKSSSLVSLISSVCASLLIDSPTDLRKAFATAWAVASSGGSLLLEELWKWINFKRCLNWSKCQHVKLLMEYKTIWNGNGPWKVGPSPSLKLLG